MTEDIARVLVVDDDPGLALNLQDILEDRGYSVSIAQDSQSALALARASEVALALVDMQLPDRPGNLLIQDLAALQPGTEFVIMTGYGSLDTAREAVTQKRVVAYETKPLDLPRFLPLLDQVVQRRRAERALQAQQARLQAITDNITDMVTLLDETNVIQYASPSFERALGYRPEELVGKHVSTLLPAGDREPAMATIRAMLQAGQGTAQLHVPAKDGGERWLDATGSYIADAAGKITGSILVSRDITAHMHADEERLATVELLRLANESSDSHDLMRAVLRYLRRWTGCEALGIRLRNQEDFPYFEVNGFADDFVQRESRLCAVDAAGNRVRDVDGAPVLECMCGNVLCGRFDPAQPFFTEYGSFWTSNVPELLATTTEEQRLGSRARNRCFNAGYQSLALIPLRTGTVTFGLMQLNDRRPGRFTAELIARLERLAGNVAQALADKRAKEALRQSEMRFRTLFEHASVSLFEADFSLAKAHFVHLRAGGVDDWRAHFAAHPQDVERCTGLVRILDLNKEAADSLGILHKGERAALAPAFAAPESRRAVTELLIALAEGATRIEGETPVQLPNGATRTLAWRLVVVPGHEETLAHVIGSYVDLTERLKMQEELAESEARLRRAVLNAPFPIVIHAEDGNILLTSQAFNEISGYSPEQIPTLAEWTARAYGDRQKAVMTGIARLYSATSRLEEGEFEIRTARGEKRIWDFSSAPLGRLPTGARLVISMAADVTERKKLEEQLRQAVKMEAIGRLAGGVAHDFNNLLTVIEGRTRFAMETLPAPADARDDLEEVLAASQRATSLTRQLLAFSRRQVLEMRILDLNQALRDMSKMLARLIGEDIVLHLRLCEGQASVRADLGQIEQVVINLAVNARDAMPQGGVLELETICRYLDEGDIAQHADLKVGNHVLLTIRDTGCGMSAEVKEHLFEPFFTTKGVGKGTGLGLATIYGIIKQSGGDVDVTSKPGLGTTFHIYLPQVAEMPGVRQPRVAAALPHGTETVLVAEDQVEVRRLTVRMLRSLGYNVLEAPLPADALRLSQATVEPIDLVISDVVMPGMSGPQLVQHLRAARPGLRVLYVSGYTDDAVEHYGLLPGSEVPLLQKPFTLDALSRQVRAVLDAASPA